MGLAFMAARVCGLSGSCSLMFIHLQYQTGAFGMHPAINLLPQRLRRLRSRPCIVVTAHDLRLPYLFPKGDRLRTWVTQRLFDDADMLIVTNDDDLRRVHGQAHLTVIVSRPRQQWVFP
jgi:hypothetical protein